MGEVEFDRLLDAVRAAIAPVAGDEIMLAQQYKLARLPADEAPAKAANDNGPVWPLIPFPEGWYAASELELVSAPVLDRPATARPEQAPPQPQKSDTKH